MNHSNPAPISTARRRDGARVWCTCTSWVGALFALLFWLVAAPASAQTAADGFNPGADYSVLRITVQPDGKLLVGGGFSKIGGQPRIGIARLNVDGSLDAGFNPEANNSVASLVVQPDGKVLVGGIFTKIGGQTRNGIARLNADGTLDAGFDPDAGNSIYVDTLAVQPDGKVLVGGDFTQMGGQARNRIARLNADGTLDAGFNPDANDMVYKLAVQPDGKVLVGGDFTQMGGQTRNSIARLNADGTLDVGFNPNASGYIHDLAVQPDGKVLVGGGFTKIGGQTRAYVARLNADGTLDAGFNPEANNRVASLVVQPDGKVLVGGFFTQIGGQARGRLARLNADGTLDAGFDPDANDGIYSLAVQPDGRVLVGGVFSGIDGQTRNNLARLNADGALEADFNPAADDLVYSAVVQPDGKLLVGGYFSQIAGQTRNRIARVNADGTLDAGFDPSANRSVFNLALQPDGKVLVGGSFTQIAGQSRNRIARLNANGTLDGGFNADADYTVQAMALLPDGKVLVGGGFTQLSGQPHKYVGRLNSDGTPDAAFNPSADGSVSSLVVQPDGKVLVGGDFGEVGGQARQYLARLNADGSLDTTFNAPVNGAVYGIAVQPDGKVLIGGGFTHVGSQAHGRLARLNANGSLDTGFTADADYAAYSFAMQPDGKILVGGDFRQISGQPRNYLARLNANGTLDAGFNPNADGGVLSLAIQPDGKVVAGGEFGQIGGQARGRLARLSVPEAATQSLDVGTNRSSVTWLRSGSGPELTHVWIERSDDGSNWASLGAATRVAGGWSLGGLNLPRNRNVWLRARGHASGGLYNGSSSLIESVQLAYLASPAVTITVSGQGQATPLTQDVDLGQNATFSVTPTPGWRLGTVIGDTCTPLDQGNGQWRVANVQANCGIAVTFVQNPPPTATAQTVSIAFNTAKAITLAGNDASTGGPFAFTYALVAQPTHGAISGFNANTGALTYTPTLGYSGSDSFTFTAKTVNGTSATATVSLTIAQGQPVTATAQNVSVPFNTAKAITLAGSDPNPGGPFAFTYALVAQPTHGTINNFDANTGALTYTPTLGYVGSDSFTFTTKTVNGTSATATVSLTIAQGQPVTATAQSVNVAFNTTQAIALAGSDTNPGGPFTFTYAIGTQPTHGTINNFDGNTGALTYTPTIGYSGGDNFTFTAKTVNGSSATATVSLTIAQGQPVTATAQSVSVPFNTAKATTLAGSDPNPGGPFAFTYTLVAQPTHGAISGFDANTGALTYTPTLGYSGGDSFTFTAKTVNGTSTAATVSLTVAQGEAVVATPQNVSVAFNTAQAITLTGSDTNPGGPFAFTYVIATPPTHGSISGLDVATGVLTYTPTLGYSGSDSFTFTAKTVNGTSVAATMSLTIAQGEAVVATPQSVSVAFNTAQAITLTGSDTNPGGPFAFTYAIVDAPSHGTISGFDASAGTLTYTPDAHFIGADRFTFTVSNVNGTSLPATVSLSVVEPQLALSIDDDREFARHGQVIDYVVTLTNLGDAANAVPVAFALSPGFDGDYARLTCFGAGDGASCTPDANDPLRYTVTLPPNRTLTWLVSVPVRSDAPDDAVTFSAEAIGAAPAADIDTLVIFRDGFDVPYGNGAQSAPVIGGTQAKAIVEGEALYEPEVPTDLTSTTTTLLIVHGEQGEVLVQARSLAGAVLARLLERDADRRERATAWSVAQAGATLVLGSVASEDAPRVIVLTGTESAVALLPTTLQ